MPENPALVAMAQRQAEHYREMAAFYESMAKALADGLWQVVLELRLPPQRIEDLPPGTPILFGMYAVPTIVERVHALVEADVKAPEDRPSLPKWWLDRVDEGLARKASLTAGAPAPTGPDSTQE